VEVFTYFGYCSDMVDLRIGGHYPWAPGKQPKNGGRPVGGNTEGEGYMECTHCHKDSFLRVIVRDDVIVGIEPDTAKRGYIPDERDVV
jgi:hypothetical protein